MSAKIYLAVYRVDLTLKGAIPAAAADFHRERESAAFPFDVGDDPSFYMASRRQGAAVTWGVCRPNIRRSIGRDDVVVFISFSVRSGEYRLVAALPVHFKIRHQAIFEFEANDEFRDYPNLLVRPRDQGWEHHEPVLPPEDWHDDWLARISKLNGISIDEFEAAGANHVRGDQLKVRGHRIEASSNYVVFERGERGFVLAHPPVIARWRTGEEGETWCTDARSREIRELTLGLAAPDRQLRVDNQIAHPHVVLSHQVKLDDWLHDLRDAACRE